MLGSEVAGIAGGDTAKAGLEFAACRVRLVEAGQDLTVEIVGGCIFRVVGNGSFEGGVSGIEEVDFVLIPGLKKESMAALSLGVGFVDGGNNDGFECGGLAAASLNSPVFIWRV